MSELIFVENKRTMALLLVAVLIFTSEAIKGGYLILYSHIEYLCLLLVYFFILGLFIKFKVKEVKE